MNSKSQFLSAILFGAAAFNSIAAAPTITAQPVSQTVLEGQNATVSVTAGGTAPLSYQWKRGTTNLVGGTNATLTLTNVAVSDTATNYSVVVTNASGSITSRPTALTVLVDFDRDGMADYWERAFSFNTNSVADASLDSDGDGVINLIEFQLGTDPMNATNVQRLAAVSYASNPAQVTLTFTRPCGLAQLCTTNYSLAGGTSGAVAVVSALPSSSNRRVTLLVDPPLETGQTYHLTAFSPATELGLSFYNIAIHAGLNLVANQLDNGSNTLNEVFVNMPGVNGFVLSKYNNAEGTWSQARSIIDIGWDPPEITLNPGEGAFLQSPSNFTLTISGAPHVPVLPIATIPSGKCYLLSDQTNRIGTFESITGTSPTGGETVFKWTGSGYSTFVFDELDLVWTPSEPTTGVGESFWICPPAAGASPPPLPNPAAIKLFINEWLADNRNGIVDPEDGQHDDWFEIYNPGTNAVDLRGLYLTDWNSNDFRFLIPAGYSIPPGGYQLVWADSDPDQNSTNSRDLHVNFTLDGGGGNIGLYAADGTAIDALSFGPQTPDVSEGRFPDGGQRSLLSPPSPGAANSSALNIYCPPDIRIDTCGSSVVVNYSNPTVTGGSFTGCSPSSGSLFSVGTTYVNCTAYRPGDFFNSAQSRSCTFAVIVTHIFPPQIFCPNSFTLDACGPTTIVNYSPSVSGGSLVGCLPPSGSPFPVGTTPVTCTAANQCSGSACMFVVTVRPLNCGSIHCPEDITNKTCGTSVAVNYPDPTIFSLNFSGCVPPSGSLFPAGTTPVTCASTNLYFTNTCTFNITVISDTTPPVLTCASNKTVECGTAWTFESPAATSAGCSTPVTITVLSTETNVSGCSQFITQTWLATDCCSNSTTCTQMVTVVDTTPPVLNCPLNLVVACTNGPDTAVVYTVTATDLCDPNVAVVCTPPSGSSFSSGATTVHCAAGDACGNSNTCAFTVTVACCASILTERVDCPTNSSGDFTYAFTLLNLSGTNASFLFLVPLNPQTMQPDTNCVNVTPGFYFLNPALASGASVPLSITLHPLANCGSNVCLLLTLHDESFGVCCSFTHCITLDATPPVIVCASNKTVECGTGWNFDAPSAFDTCCGTNVTIIVLGTTTNGSGCLQTLTRTWQATDCRANTSTCSQTVTVRDTTPPVLTCATNKTVECGTAWNFDQPIVSDACCGTNITLTILGTTTNGVCSQVIQRTWRARDCCTNSITCTQTVTVVDTTAPILNCPSNLVVACTNPAGVSVSYSVTATDLCSTNVLVVCAPPSGSLFPAGSSSVQCAAVDVCGNRKTCAFTVTVDCPCVIITNETVVISTNGTFLYSFDITNLTTTLVKVVALVPDSDCFSFQPPLITLPTALATGQGAHLSVTVTLGINCPAALCFVFGLHNSNLVECCSVHHCVALPPAAPVFTPAAAAFLNNTFCLSVPTQPGAVYVIEYKNSLSEPTWQILTAFTGDGGMTKVIDPSPAAGSRYYRVVLYP